MKKLPFVASIVFIFCVSLFVPKQVRADGMSIRPYADRWDYVGEQNQLAFINYEDGVETLVLSVGFKGLESDGAVWLFPVPAHPSKITVDVLDTLPFLQGDEISKKSSYHLAFAKAFLFATQLYPIPFVSFLDDVQSGFPVESEGFLGGGSGSQIAQDVMVYQHLEKEGIVSEVISAQTGEGLFDYLRGKELIIEQGALPVLNQYIGNEFSFVASWIDPLAAISLKEIKDNLNHYFLFYQYFMTGRGVDGGATRYPKFYELVNRLKQKYPEMVQVRTYTDYTTYFETPQGLEAFQELVQTIQHDPTIVNWDRSKINPYLQKGVKVIFPVREMYFPLLPTSVYGDTIVPATIRVMGHVSPKVYQDIKDYTKVEYYAARNTPQKILESFLQRPRKEITYTKIEINAPSKLLTDDLWIEERTPPKTYLPSVISQHPIASALFLLILNSFNQVSWLAGSCLRS